jgi:hypothetical protein
MEQAKAVLKDVTYCDGPYSCAEGADALVIVTEWEQFRALDFDRLKELMACPVLVDLRNVYRHEAVVPHGFLYHSVGRPELSTGFSRLISCNASSPPRSWNSLAPIAAVAYDLALLAHIAELLGKLNERPVRADSPRIWFAQRVHRSSWKFLTLSVVLGCQAGLAASWR